MFSNKKNLFYGALLLLTIQLPIYAQQASIKTQALDSVNRLITEAILTVDAKKLSGTFHEKVDLSLTDNQGIYSSSQAQYIISSFFKKSPVLSYQIISENVTNNSNVVVGLMQTPNQYYRVCYLVKQELTKPEVYQFRIEK